MDSPKHVKKRRSSASSTAGAGPLARGRRRAFGPFHFRYEKLVKQLLTAVDEGDVDTIQECLDAGVDLSAAGSGQAGLASGALHAACEAGHCDSVVTLLNGGASINELSSRDCAPIHLAARCGHLSILALLLSQGASVAATSRFEARTPLHAATVAGRTACARLLLESGADVSARDIYGSQPLHLAARCGNGALLELLFTYGADVNAADKDGWTALHLSAESGQIDAVRALLQARAQVDCQNKYGRTPLHWAAASGQASVVKVLLAADADAAVRDLHGKFADAYATNLGIRQALQSRREDAHTGQQYVSTIGLFVQIDQRRNGDGGGGGGESGGASPLSSTPEPPLTPRLTPEPHPTVTPPSPRPLSRRGSPANDGPLTPCRTSGLLSPRRSSDSSLASSDGSYCNSGVGSSRGRRSPSAALLVRALSCASTRSCSSDRQAATPVPRSPPFVDGDSRRPFEQLRSTVNDNIDQLQSEMQTLTVEISLAIDATATPSDAVTRRLKGAYGRVQTIQHSLYDLKEVVTDEVERLSAQFLHEPLDDRPAFGLVHCFLHAVALSLTRQPDGWRKLLYTTEMTRPERDATIASVTAADADTALRTANAVMHWAKWQHMKEPPLVIKSLLAALGECGFNDDAVEALVNDFTALMLPDDSDVLTDKVLGQLAHDVGADCHKLAARLAVRSDHPEDLGSPPANLALLLRWKQRVRSMQQLPAVETCALLCGALVDVGREDLLPALLQRRGPAALLDDFGVNLLAHSMA